MKKHMFKRILTGCLCAVMILSNVVCAFAEDGSAEEMTNEEVVVEEHTIEDEKDVESLTSDSEVTVTEEDNTNNPEESTISTKEENIETKSNIDKETSIIDENAAECKKEETKESEDKLLYTVKFYVDNEVISEQCVEKEKGALAPEEPQKENRTFIGWDVPFDSVQNDLDIHALFKENEEDVKDEKIEVKKETLSAEIVEEATMYMREKFNSSEILDSFDLSVGDDTKFPVQITFNANVSENDSIQLLHKADEWEVITPDQVKEDEITATFNSLSPVVVVKVTEDDKKKLVEKELYKDIDNINIMVSGKMPENAVLEVSSQGLKEYQNIIENFDYVGKLMKVYDIKIMADETEYEPEEYGETVEVKFSNLETINDGGELNIIHFNDQTKSPEILSDYVDTSSSNGEIKVETDSFSSYGIGTVTATASMTVEDDITVPLIEKNGTIYHMYLSWGGKTKEAFCLDIGKAAHTNDKFYQDGFYTENANVQKIIGVFGDLTGKNMTYTEAQSLIWGALEGYFTENSTDTILNSLGTSTANKTVIKNYLFDIDETHSYESSSYLWINEKGTNSDGYQRFVTYDFGTKSVIDDSAQDGYGIYVKAFYSKKAWNYQNVYAVNQSTNEKIYATTMTGTGVYFIPIAYNAEHSSYQSDYDTYDLYINGLKFESFGDYIVMSGDSYSSKYFTSTTTDEYVSGYSREAIKDTKHAFSIVNAFPMNFYNSDGTKKLYSTDIVSGTTYCKNKGSGIDGNNIGLANYIFHPTNAALSAYAGTFKVCQNTMIKAWSLEANTDATYRNGTTIKTILSDMGSFTEYEAPLIEKLDVYNTCNPGGYVKLFNNGNVWAGQNVYAINTVTEEKINAEVVSADAGTYFISFKDKEITSENDTFYIYVNDIKCEYFNAYRIIKTYYSPCWDSFFTATTWLEYNPYYLDYGLTDCGMGNSAYANAHNGNSTPPFNLSYGYSHFVITAAQLDFYNSDESKLLDYEIVYESTSTQDFPDYDRKISSLYNGSFDISKGDTYNVWTNEKNTSPKFKNNLDVSAVFTIVDYSRGINTNNMKLYYDFDGPEEYKITFDDQDATTAGSIGSVYNNVTLYPNSLYTDQTYTTQFNTYSNIADKLPTKTGYVFNGYYTEANGKGTRVYNALGGPLGIGGEALPLPLTSNITLYAYWTKDNGIISFDNQGATTAGTDKLYFKIGNSNYYTSSDFKNTTYSITKPTKSGYVFNGYFTEKNGNGVQIFNKNGSRLYSASYFTDDTTLYAYWAEKSLVTRVLDHIEATYNGADLFINAVISKDDITVIPYYKNTYDDYSIDVKESAALNSTDFSISPVTIASVGNNEVTVNFTDTGVTKTDDITIKGKNKSEVSRVQTGIEAAYAYVSQPEGDEIKKSDVTVYPIYKVTYDDGSVENNIKGTTPIAEEDFNLSKIIVDKEENLPDVTQISTGYNDGIEVFGNYKDGIKAFYPRAWEYVGTVLKKNDFTVIYTYTMKDNDGTIKAKVPSPSTVVVAFEINTDQIELGSNDIIVTEIETLNKWNDLVKIEGKDKTIAVNRPTDPAPTPSKPSTDPENPTPTIPDEPVIPPVNPIISEEPIIPEEPVTPSEPQETPDVEPVAPTEEKVPEVVPDPAKPIPVIKNDVPSSSPEKSEIPTISKKKPISSRSVIATLVVAGITVALVTTGMLDYIWMLLICLLLKRKRKQFHGILTNEENRFIEVKAPEDCTEIVQDIIDRTTNIPEYVNDLLNCEAITYLPANTKMTVLYTDETGIEQKFSSEANEESLLKVLDKLDGKGEITVELFCKKANFDIVLIYNV